ncbi:MAG: ParB/RepB/Spo0J family partition protein [Saprospiraceae bacterium]|jgi:ParB family chromosome partitioning protein|nr:ParB/RepB/Spo0J family partition protein [Saprospiraceae bacterium]
MAKQLVKVGKRELGSGIDALFSPKIDQEIQDNPEKVVREFSSVFATVPIGQVEANPDQPRKDFSEEALQELAESIKVHGLIQPITVRRLSNHEFQLISGERRWRASKIAGLTEIPAYIRIANDQAMLEMALIENIQRENLNAVEIAITYHRLKEECSLTDEQLAERVGKKRSTVTNYLRLLDLHIEVLEAVKQDRISMGHARALAGIEDKLLQKQALDEVLKKDLSVRDTEKLARDYTKPRKTTPAVTPSKGNLSEDHQRMLHDFRAFFGSGKILMSLEDATTGKGQIVIPFNSHDELNEFFKCIEQ